LIIVLVSNAILLLNNFAAQLRSLISGGLDTYLLISRILDQFTKMYYAKPPDPLTIMNVLVTSILIALLSWRLTTYYVMATLMLSIAECLILASLGVVEYVSMLNVLTFWSQQFSVYTAYVFQSLVEWAREQVMLLVLLAIASSALAFSAVKLDLKNKGWVVKASQTSPL